MMPLLVFTKVPRSNKTWKHCANISRKVAEYLHRSVESIWRRFKPRNSLSSGAIHCSPCSLVWQFRVSKRSSKLRRMSPASWVNLPNTFAMFTSVLALDFIKWKSLIGLPNSRQNWSENQWRNPPKWREWRRREVREKDGKSVLTCEYLPNKYLIYFPWK